MSSPTSLERIPLAEEPAADEFAAILPRVRAALEAGGIVALPTETVYGLAVRADHPGAPAALRAAKARDPALALTWHVGEDAALEAFPQLSAMARRLAQRYWPGPLTLVLPGVPAGLEAAARDGWTGVRRPAYAATARLLAALDFPVVATSANTSGEPALTEPDEVAAALGEHIALLLDGGPSRLAEASSVLAVGPGRFEVLRKGLIDAEGLRRTAGLRLAFCCTGNTCRSPMAEALARVLLAQRLGLLGERAGGAPAAGAATLEQFGFEVASMGVVAGAGGRAAAHSVEAIAEVGGDLSQHTTTPARPGDIAAFDRVYAMTASHLAALRALLPPGGAEHVALLSPTGEEVLDPIGGSLDQYRRCRDQMRAMIEARLGEWA